MANCVCSAVSGGDAALRDSSFGVGPGFGRHSVARADQRPPIIVKVMRRLIVLELFSGPAWRDASGMVGHVAPGAAGGWLLVAPEGIHVVPEPPDGEQVLRDAQHGGPSFLCRAWYTTAGTDRPTVHTVAVGDADLYEEVLTSVGFSLDEPQGVELRSDESGVYRGYYI